MSKFFKCKPALITGNCTKEAFNDDSAKWTLFMIYSHTYLKEDGLFKVLLCSWNTFFRAKYPQRPRKYWMTVRNEWNVLVYCNYKRKWCVWCMIIIYAKKWKMHCILYNQQDYLPSPTNKRFAKIPKNQRISWDEKVFMNDWDLTL